MTSQPLGAAVRSSAGKVLHAADSRRLRLGDLPSAPRRLATAGLATSSVAALVLVLTPLEVQLPGGTVLLLRADAPRIGNVQLAVFLLAIALAMSTLTMAAIDRSPRVWRPVIAGVAVLGLVITPSVLTIPGVTPPVVVGGLLSLLAIGLLLGVAVIGRPSHALGLAVLSAIPPIGALIAYMGAGLPSAPNGLQSEIATSLLNGALIAEAPLVALAAWAVIEYGRGLAGSVRPLAQSEMTWAWFPPTLFTLKVIVLLAALGGFASAFTGITPEFLTAPLRESVLTIVLAATITIFIGWWLLYGPRPRSLGRGATQGVWVIVLLILIGYSIPIAAFAAGLLPERIGIGSSVTDIQGWMDTVDTVQALAISLTPALVSLAALLGGVGTLVWGGGRRRGIALLLVAYAVWTLIPGISFAMTERDWAVMTDLNGGPLGQIHPVTMDLFITILVGILMAGWFFGLQRRASPMVLLMILGLSTAVTYAGALLAAEVGAILFWLGFAFPLAAQFLLDSVGLNRQTEDRPGRVLGAVGFSTLSLSMALPLVALGFASPDAASTDAFVKALVLVPFAAVLGASAVAAQDSQTAAAGPRRFTTRAAFLAGVVVLATLGTAGTLLARQDSPPLAPDPAIVEGNGFSVRIPPEYAMTHTDEGSDQWLSADGTRALLVFAYALDEPADPLGAAASMLDSRLDAVGSAVVESLEPFEIPGVDALVGRAEATLHPADSSP